ncbi:MAG: SIR2 family protein [Planctomycetes bacterium]|nr:SIR2 family protein [Planctomycetota bacterium]
MPGHVFLIHGDLTKLACDAFLVPSGGRPWPGSLWKHAVAENAPPGIPDRWEPSGPRVLPWGARHSGGPRPWLTKTSNAPSAPPGSFVEPAREFLKVAFASLETSARNRRALPLLALPVVGAGHAGGARQAGEIVRHLLPALYEFTATHPVDVALVMKEPVQHAAAQGVRSRLMGDRAWPELDDSLREKADGLAALASRRELVLFLGAGVSQAAGLSSWNGLLEQLAGADLACDPDFRALGALDQARVVKALLPKDCTLGQAVADRLGATHYSVVHALLATLPTTEAVTTNYDTLFEMASAAVGRPVDVLPYQAASGSRPWLLKLHGCVSQPADIVLTREDYLRYDSSRAALAGLVQGLLITRHMLFVGFSLVDDNFHRIADAVRRAVKREPFGTSLSVAGNRLLRQVWDRDLDWVELGGLPGSARLLEVFLDRLAGMTAVTGGHLFDQKYEATLTETEIALRDRLRNLSEFTRDLPKQDRQGAAWEEVRGLLARLGDDWAARK